MQGVLAQKRAVTAPQQLRTGMPAHLDIASASAAMALDVLALSHETEAMNDECLRVGIWNYVVPSLMMLRDDEYVLIGSISRSSGSALESSHQSINPPMNPSVMI